jgi:hypothetical protein
MSTSTNGLARKYNKLTPWERVPLLMAARCTPALPRVWPPRRQADDRIKPKDDARRKKPTDLVRIRPAFTLETADLCTWPAQS